MPVAEHLQPQSASQWAWAATSTNLAAGITRKRQQQPETMEDHHFELPLPTRGLRFQFATDCTALNGTVSAPISNCMPLLRLCTPVAVPVTVNGSAEVVPLAFSDTTAAL